MGALDGVRVVEVTTGIAGSLAAMLLADFGADVVKVEDPTDARRRASPGFAVWDRGKRSVTSGLDRWLGAADVCIVDRTEGALARRGLDAATLLDLAPRLVHVRVSPFLDGRTWAGGLESDALLAAATGVSLRQASNDGGPVDEIYPHLVTVQGIWAAAACVAALVERQQSGLGQAVEVSGIRGAMIASAAAFNFDASAAPVASSRVGGGGGSVPFYKTYECGDGEWLFLAALTPVFTGIAFDVLGVNDLLDDPRLDGKGRAAILRPENLGWVVERLASVFRTATRDEWVQRLMAAGCPCGPVLERDDWLDHPQLGAIGMRVEVDDPTRGRVVMPGIPIQLTGSPGAVRGPAPACGAHDADTPDDWAGNLAPLPRSPTQSRRHGPLDGVRVIDLGAIIAGPFSASLLGELGADVIKVEPLTGDSFRGPGFAAYNKGQRGIAIDLRQPDGKQALLDLVVGADVVIDNYRPGVLSRLGITYDDLRAVNERIITLSMTGFGEGGPLGNEAGFDPVLQAMSGMMKAQGGDDAPVFFTVPVNDVAAAASGALAACLALHHRGRTGEGQRAWTSLAGMATLLQAGELVRWAGREPARRGSRDHRGPGPLDCYVEVADGWLRVAASEDDVEAKAYVEQIRALTRAEASKLLHAAGIPAKPAVRAADLADDRAAIDAEVLHRDPRPGRESWWTAGRHARFSRTERSGTLLAPALGQHTREVLREVGYADEKIDALITAGAALAATSRQ